MLDRLHVWHDPIRRSGPENMAVDHWLLQTENKPMLRIYGWEGDWVSLGYFGGLEETRALFPGVELVRRETGGGIVDHRIDCTYTLTIPRREELANLRGAESYRTIHTALTIALGRAGGEVSLIAEDRDGDSPACFEKPVAWDIVDSQGRKVAGAGQRRSRKGLLHQGSLILPEGCDRDRLFSSFAGLLSEYAGSVDREPPGMELAAPVEKFASEAWLGRR